MTESDPEDDPQLRALRSVWLSLPDEEPPQRGMAELMAAARARSEQMARPPWWRRVRDLLRRPPVLALATVTVLIGGAVLLTRHRNEIASGPEPVPAPAAGSAAVQAPSAPPASDVPTQAAPEPGYMGKDRELSPPPPPPRAPPRKAPEHHTAAPPVEGKKARVESDRLDFTSETNGRAPRNDREDSKQQPATEAPQLEEPNDAMIVSPPRKANGGKATLVEQCRSAAARGDCAAARALAARIARQDAASYRDQIATDSTIAKCLASP